MRTIGFERPLYILPFDHRGSFQTKMFGWHGDLDAAQTAQVASAKQVIYDGFKAAIAAGVPKEKAGILVDEQFGTAILRDAAANGYTTACPAEKSGQDEFDFEYGADFARHIQEAPTDVLQSARPLQSGRRSRVEQAPDGASEATLRLSARQEPEPVHVRVARAG
jgi:myo-inositol catabolism protein IolC